MVSSANCNAAAAPRGTGPGARPAVEPAAAGQAAAADVGQDVWSMLTCCMRPPRRDPDEELVVTADAGDAEGQEPPRLCEEVVALANKPSVQEQAVDNYRLFNEITCPPKEACAGRQGADSSPVHSPFARSTTCSTCCSFGAEQRGQSVDSATSVQDPKQVVRLEWRSVRRMMSLGLTSHSMLDVVLLGGGRMRYQKFSNLGVVMSRLTPAEADEGTIYCGRVASADDFAQPLREADVYAAARVFSYTPYDLLAANCHHFVRDLWNSLVSTPLRAEDYPDQLKAAVALQLREQLDNLPNCGDCSSVSQSFASLGGERCC